MPSRNPILILHGWSDNAQSFAPIKSWLTRERGYRVEEVFLGNYESMEDHVTFDDLAVGLQLRLNAMVRAQRITLAPFSLDVLVHSTGGPLLRHWFQYYMAEIAQGDRSQCPLRAVIMLAPANFGSRLAAQGKTALAKLFKGGTAHGFQTGRRILEGLELGSPTFWDFAHRDLFVEPAFYPCVRDRGPYVYIFSGTRTYGELKGLVAKGANENGSDGTVRAAAAALNSIKIRVDYTQPEGKRVSVRRQANASFAFRLIPGKNHSEIVPREPWDQDHPMVEMITRCLEATTHAEYEQIVVDFENANDTYYAEQERKRAQGENDAEMLVDDYQQFVVHMQDEMGNDVTDYRLDFHVVNNDIVQSTWTSTDDPGPLKRYQKYTDALQSTCIEDVQTHSVNASYRTFFVNLRCLRSLQAKLKDEPGEPYIGMNVDATGPTADLFYDTDKLKYLRVEVPLTDASGAQMTFFKRNTSTLVEIILERAPNSNIVDIT